MIGLDFETYGTRNLPAVGLYNYTADEYFQPLLAAVAYEGVVTHVIDFSQDFEHALAELYGLVVVPARERGHSIVAHNAGFERAVLRAVGYELPADAFIDSAVIARALGFGGSLEAAAPQMLDVEKLESGKELIKLFSIGDGPFDPTVVTDNPDEWDLFKTYCQVDAELSLRIAVDGLRTHPWLFEELDWSAMTMAMNDRGWPVDKELLDDVEWRYRHNVHMLEQDFRTIDSTLNLSSHKQLVEWCRERGVRAKSFDEKAVAKLVMQVTKKLNQIPHDDPKAEGYQQVLYMLQTKQAMGGSSPKKLEKIRATMNEDHRLRDQYLHIGAGLTFRTSGRGVQMQNLPRLYGEGDDVAHARIWTNDEIAHNLRQVFRAHDEHGQIIVGDFASVESRGLAWQADEQWKLDIYRDGGDVYKQLAAQKFHVPYDEVTKDQRMFGKVGELSCGYGAGDGAVQSFAEGMGMQLSDTEAIDLVRGWRDANPNIVNYWRDLEATLNRLMALHVVQHYTPNKHMTLEMRLVGAPQSLIDQTEGAVTESLEYSVWLDDSAANPFMVRTIHGVHRDGRNVGYFRSTSRKTGDLWVDRYTDPKTGHVRKYSLYGGKLAGLLTQSLCRQLFFHALQDVEAWSQQYANLRVIGQFHDEIVVEWQPTKFVETDGRLCITLGEAQMIIRRTMSAELLEGFPMAAVVHSAPRYIK